MPKLRVLLVGQALELLNTLPFLFFRAGFEVDVLVNFFLRKNRFISNLEIVEDAAKLFRRVAEKNLDCYDLVMVCDDTSLKRIAELNLPLEQKIKLLPVSDESDFQHLFSKIGLSKVLKQKGICTPDFVVVNNFEEIAKAATDLGFPVLLKPDQSSGGQGILEFSNQLELDSCTQKNLSFPRLLQKKIEGEEFDLSAFYLDQKLIHFSYSKIIKKFGNEFSISLLRSYSQLATLKESVFIEIAKLGQALGGNGFISISAIKSKHDGRFYFFEADARPNTWIDHTRFFGDDLAPKIANYFSKGETLKYPQPLAEEYSSEVIIPMCLRLNFFEIIFNRYNVWSFISISGFEYFYNKSLTKIKYLLWRINRIPTLTIRALLPKKEQRKKIKLLLKRFFRTRVIISQ